MAQDLEAQKLMYGAQCIGVFCGNANPRAFLCGFQLVLNRVAQPLDLGQFEKMMPELQPYIKLWQSSRIKESSAVAAG